MEEILIEFETAKLAREKGFNIRVPYGYTFKSDFCAEKILLQCFNFHNFGDCESFDWNNKIFEHYPNGVCSAPTQALLQTWLRVKHKIEVNVLSDQIGYMLVVVKRNDRLEVLEIERNIFERYEEALEEGLLIGLKDIE